MTPQGNNNLIKLTNWKRFSYWPSLPRLISALFVKLWGQDGRILARFLFYIFMGQEEVKINKTLKEKRKKTRQISSHLDWTRFVNTWFYIWPKSELLVGSMRENLSRHDEPTLPARVANQNRGFGSSCLLTGFNHIIMHVIIMHLNAI